MVSQSTPPLTALQIEILEEFGAVSFRSERFEVEAMWEAETAARKREVDAARKRRTRAEIFADLRRLQDAEEGVVELEFEWRVCPTCRVQYAVLLPERGRPRVYCCRAHAVVAAVRGWRRRLCAR